MATQMMRTSTALLLLARPPLVGFLSSLLLLAAGCVTYEEERISPSRQTTLTVARVGETVSLQFPSEKGYIYSVVYTVNLSSGSWLPLPNGQNLRGTGKIVSLEDRVPDGTQRYYRLLIQPAESTSSKRSRK